MIQESTYIEDNEAFLILVIQESSYIEDNDVFPNPGDPRIQLHRR